ncbi:MAG: hypothetical protein QGI33_01160 [Candidatus Brocadiia bacterium]|jgi:hypothetical protein|nr:hypothetical protein [Candidatus Brocadiia bacterium]
MAVKPAAGAIPLYGSSMTYETMTGLWSEYSTGSTCFEAICQLGGTRIQSMTTSARAA